MGLNAKFLHSSEMHDSWISGCCLNNRQIYIINCEGVLQNIEIWIKFYVVFVLFWKLFFIGIILNECVHCKEQRNYKVKLKYTCIVEIIAFPLRIMKFSESNSGYS